MISDIELSQLSFADLQGLRKRVDDRLNLLHKEESEKAINQVRQMVATYGLTAADVFGRGRGGGAALGARAGVGTGAKVAPKYRDPATGLTWTGRGKAPKWINGQDRDAFLIARDAP